MEATVFNTFFSNQKQLLSILKPRIANTPMEQVSDKNALSSDVGQTSDMTSPENVLIQRVIDSLNQSLAGTGAAEIGALDPQDFTPEKVSGRILNSISGYLATFMEQNPDEDNLNDFFRRVRAGFERGFAEAEEILEGLGVLQEGVKEGIYQTYGLVSDGIDRLAGQVSNTAEPVKNSVDYTERSFAASFRSSQSGQIAIETQEGDIVTIEFNQSSNRSIAAYESIAGEGVAQGIQRNTSFDSSLTYTVQGDLSKEETQAIDKLIRRIDNVADRFFDGNIGRAFTKARKIKFDNEQLAGFSVELSSLIATSMQATESQSTVRTDLSKPDTALADNPLRKLLADDLGNIIKQLQQISDEVKDMRLLGDPEKIISSLFQELFNRKSNNVPLESTLDQVA